MSELKGADIAARIGAGAPDERERSKVETWISEASARDPNAVVQEKLRVTRRIREALDRASSITGKSKNELMNEFIIEGLRRLHTAEQAATRRRAAAGKE
jgi:hypothetical protein